VSHLRDEAYVNDDITKATSMELVNTMKDLLNMNPLYGEQFRTLMSLTGGRGEEEGAAFVAVWPAC
jgi:Lon-like ATP-dependent protease